jgi:F-type H+-transporting ATPase subunit delta
MKSNEVAKRYAKALYQLAVENKTQETVIAHLRALNEIFAKDPAALQFLVSPLVTATEREAVLTAALKDKGLAKEVVETALLLARNDRFALFSELVTAFESEADKANNVCRGTVRSATALGQTERQRVEETVERVLKKKVIMTYKIDPAVIGGLVAQVGSYTFDDSIDSHLKRMNEELKRRTV